MPVNGAVVRFEPKVDLRKEAERASFKFLRMCFVGHMPKTTLDAAAERVNNAVELLRQSGEKW